MEQSQRPPRRIWIQRLPLFLFIVLCVVAALVAACIFFILGAVVEGIFELIFQISDKNIEPVLLLALASAGTMITVILLVRARTRDSANNRHGLNALTNAEAEFAPNHKAKSESQVVSNYDSERSQTIREQEGAENEKAN